MNNNTLFSLINLLVLPFWIIMIALPRRRWAWRTIESPLIVAAPALVYSWLVAPRALRLSGEFGSLQSVSALLGTPFGALAGWAHFLAFDLFVGRWIYLDGYKRGISALLLAPVLVLTLLFGPIGFVCYLLLRYVTTGSAPVALRRGTAGVSE